VDKRDAQNALRYDARRARYTEQPEEAKTNRFTPTKLEYSRTLKVPRPFTSKSVSGWSTLF